MCFYCTDLCFMYFEFSVRIYASFSEEPSCCHVWGERTLIENV